MTTIEKQVGASAGDCWANWNGTAWEFEVVRNYQQAGWHHADFQKMGDGMRFTGVTIPADATITTAYLILYAWAALDGVVVRTRISAEQSIAAAQFSDYTNYAARVHTTTVVDWDGMEGWLANVAPKNSAEIKSVIQELVEDYSGLSNADIVIFWDDHDDRSDHNASTQRTGVTYDQNPTYAPKLHIKYTVPAVGRSFGFIIG